MKKILLPARILRAKCTFIPPIMKCIFCNIQCKFLQILILLGALIVGTCIPLRRNYSENALQANLISSRIIGSISTNVNFAWHKLKWKEFKYMFIERFTPFEGEIILEKWKFFIKEKYNITQKIHCSLTFFSMEIKGIFQWSCAQIMLEVKP